MRSVKQGLYGLITALLLTVHATSDDGLTGDASPPAAGVPAQTDAPSLHLLTKTDVDAWLDGFVPYALQAADIAGGVVVVVKDGKVLTERGFGYADVAKQQPVDPDITLFRPGSISKLFTWTAVMQQVEAGKIDLDRNINDYLDFRIPDTFKTPITMRNLMTHTPGFEDTIKDLIRIGSKIRPSLAHGLKRWTPTRIYQPGAVPAYSNYGAALAGYIVERVSGERFEDYIQRHILEPLGMTHSTFEQSLPPSLAADMSKGYARASGTPKGFETLDLGPAGALTASGADMAKFMIAQLNGGAGLMKPETARLMHKLANRNIPGLPGMALGFYHEDRDGLTIIGHGGDTNWFHSDLHLYLGKDVGLFLSFNSPGKDGAAHVLRQEIFYQFTHRYMAPPAPQPATDADAHRYGVAVAGDYISARGGFTNWLRLIAAFNKVSVSLNPDDTITVSMLTDAAGNPKRWRSVAPWQWREVGGDQQLAAKVEDGKVVALAPDWFAPIITLLPAPASLDAGWIVPSFFIAFIIVLATALSWPAIAFLRWRYAYESGPGVSPRWVVRLNRIGAWGLVLSFVAWGTILTLAMSDALDLGSNLDGWMRLIQLMTLVGVAGTLAATGEAYHLFRAPGKSWVTKGWSAAFALSGLFLCWLLISARTLNLLLHY